MSAAAEAASTPAADQRRPWAIATLVASLVGLTLGVVLTVQHYTHGELAGCSSTGFFNCDFVNHSVYSEVRGIPVAALGAITYLLMAGLSFTRIRKGPVVAAGSAAYAFLLAAISILLSAFLAWKSKFELGTFCLYCLGLYATNLVLFLASWMALGGPSRFLPAVKGDWEGLGSMRWLAYLFVVVLVGSGGWTFTHCGGARYCLFTGGVMQAWGAENKAREEIAQAPFVNPGPGGAYCKGPANAPLTIVEFADLQCPACRATSWILDPWQAKHAAEVRLCFRHYPLDMGCNPEIKHKIHEHACEGALATEAAGLQGKFWEMHDLIYQHYDEQGRVVQGFADTSSAANLERAKALHLDPIRFENDQKSPAVQDKLRDDVMIGNQVGVQSTPTLFINGRLITGGQPEEYLDTFLDMAKKGELDPTGPKAKSAG